jgi:small nuclear ribonucleoprotein (snRNP)-like protein
MDLNSLLYSTLQITIKDGRAFIGHFVCTDHDQNIILAQAEELLPKHLLDDPEECPITVGTWGGREMGLVMIKGKDVVKIEAQLPSETKGERDDVT